MCIVYKRYISYAPVILYRLFLYYWLCIHIASTNVNDQSCLPEERHTFWKAEYLNSFYWRIIDHILFIFIFFVSYRILWVSTVIFFNTIFILLFAYITVCYIYRTVCYICLTFVLYLYNCVLYLYICVCYTYITVCAIFFKLCVLHLYVICASYLYI